MESKKKKKKTNSIGPKVGEIKAPQATKIVKCLPNFAIAFMKRTMMT